MTINKQIYANNAKSTLLGTLNAGDLSITLAAGTGPLFPTGLTTGQYFLVTVESAGLVEIIKCTARTGDIITVAASGRAQEGTTAQTFPVGSIVEMRVTRDTLSTMAKLSERLFEFATLDLLDTPINSDGNSYITHSNDDSGFPIYAIKNGNNKWSFPTHERIATNGAATAGTNNTLNMTSTAIASLIDAAPASGKYIVQFLTINGVASGLSRLVTASGLNTITWSPALPGSVVVGDTFEIYQSNSSILALTATVTDDILVNAIIFGET